MFQLQSATEHYRRQQHLQSLGLVGARRLREQPTRLLAFLVSMQVRTALDAIRSVQLMLDEQNVTAPAVAEAVPESLAGVTSAGFPLERVLRLNLTDTQFDRLVTTQLQDVARQGAAIEMAARPKVTGYTRMLVPPSCSRCVILAGRRYGWNQGFQRHPRCDCRHVPGTSRTAGKLTLDTSEYFDKLTPQLQDKTFTKAGAEAIRLGADPATVVNARRGMDTAQWTTTSGALRGRRRLMPESILTEAADRADAIRLLTEHRYIK